MNAPTITGAQTKETYADPGPMPESPPAGAQLPGGWKLLWTTDWDEHDVQEWSWVPDSQNDGGEPSTSKASNYIPEPAKPKGETSYERFGKFNARDIDELAKPKYKPKYIIDGVLAERRSFILGGKKKTLKSSIAVDLALSLASGKPFLGRFPVDRPRRVLLLAGESKGGLLEESVFRILKGKELTRDDVRAHFHWDDCVPRIENMEDMMACERIILSGKPEVVIFDNLLKMISGDEFANAPKMVEIYSRLTDMVEKHDATPICCHHIKKTWDGNTAPDIDDLAGAGAAEHFRQWMLLSRRERYKGDGFHALWMDLGGSDGSCSKWALNCNEGDPSGPREAAIWKTAAVRDGEYYKQEEAQQQSDKDDRKAAKAEEQLTEEFSRVRVASEEHGAQSQSALGELAGISTRRWKKLFPLLLEAGKLEEVQKSVTYRKSPIKAFQWKD